MDADAPSPLSLAAAAEYDDGAPSPLTLCAS